MIDQIKLVFRPSTKRVYTALNDPTKEAFFKFIEDIDNWDNTYVSLKGGIVYSLRDFVIKLAKLQS